MPIVQVFYRYGKCTPKIVDALKKGVRDVGVARLSVSDRQLAPKSFKFKFVQPNKHDELEADFIVMIPLHDDPQRIAHGPGILAGQMATAITTNWSELPDVDLTVDVQLMFGIIGWGSATTD